MPNGKEALSLLCFLPLMYFTCLHPSRTPAWRMESYTFFPTCFHVAWPSILPIPLGWKGWAFSLFFLFDWNISLHPASSFPSWYSLPPSHTPCPLPLGAGGVKWVPRDLIYGEEEWKSHRCTIFNILSRFYCNLWCERQFRGTLYNVGQCRVYGNWPRMVENHISLYPVDSLGAEHAKYFCFWMCCRA